MTRESVPDSQCTLTRTPNPATRMRTAAAARSALTACGVDFAAGWARSSPTTIGSLPALRRVEMQTACSPGRGPACRLTCGACTRPSTLRPTLRPRTRRRRAAWAWCWNSAKVTAPCPHTPASHRSRPNSSESHSSLVAGHQYMSGNYIISTKQNKTHLKLHLKMLVILMNFENVVKLFSQVAQVKANNTCSQTAVCRMWKR